MHRLLMADAISGAVYKPTRQHIRRSGNLGLGYCKRVSGGATSGENRASDKEVMRRSATKTCPLGAESGAAMSSKVRQTDR